jgi:hypothetical protein
MVRLKMPNASDFVGWQLISTAGHEVASVPICYRIWLFILVMTMSMASPIDGVVHLLGISTDIYSTARLCVFFRTVRDTVLLRPNGSCRASR